MARIFFDTAIAANVEISAVKRISFLGYYRLAGNTATIRWLTDEVGVVQLQLRNKVTS